LLQQKLQKIAYPLVVSKLLHSYGKWPIEIVDLPKLKDGDFPVRYVFYSQRDGFYFKLSFYLGISMPPTEKIPICSLEKEHPELAATLV
jgi:hypothetical protein